MPKIPEDVLRSIQQEIDDADHGGKSAVVRDWAARFDCSPKTLRRHLGKVRPLTAKRKRAPRPPEVEWKWIERVAQLKIRVEQAGLEARELSTEEAIRVLEEAGEVPPGLLTVSTVNRRLDEAGFRDEDPKVRVETDFANQVWQFDFSRSKYVQVLRREDRLDGEPDYLCRISGRHLHYKENGRLRNLWLCQVKDSYSRARLSRGYVSTGETAELGWTFLDWAFARPDDGHPMRGVPHVLKVDQGAFGKHHATALACEAYDIDLRLSKPYNKDSQGKVERAWRSLWQEFEMALVARHGVGFTLRLSEYNDALAEHLARDLDKRHPERPSLTRRESYGSTLAAHPRRDVAPGVYRHVFRIEERTVKPEQRVRIDNAFYAVPHEVDGVRIKPGMRVRLMVNLDGEVRGQCVDVWTPYFELGPWSASAWDDFSDRAPSTWRQQQEAQVARRRRERTELPGQDGRHDDAPPADRGATVHTLSPRVETVAPASPFADAPDPMPSERTLTEHEARVRIGSVLVSLGYSRGFAAFEDQLAPHVRGGLTEAEADDLIHRLSSALRKTA